MRAIQIIGKLSVCAILFAGLSGCKDTCTDACNPKCENYDPCCPVQAADASFEVMQRPDKPSGMQFLSFDPVPIYDAVYGYTVLELKAHVGFSDYQYLFIKDGEILNRPNIQDGKPNYSFQLGNYAEPYDLRIRLQVHQEGAHICEKDTFDAREQVIRVLPFGNNPIFGRYIGNYEAPYTQSADFEIHIEKADYMDPVDTLWYEDHLKPFLVHQQCASLSSKAIAEGFISYGNSHRCCRKTEAVGKLINDSKIEVTVNYRDVEPCEVDHTDPRIEKVFIGTRIP